jgi:hypothetical protein
MNKATLLVALLVLSISPVAFAQVGSDPIVGHFAGGWVEPQGKTADVVDPGWNFSGGATFFRDPHKPLGIRLDVSYNWFWATKQTLDSANGSGAVQRVDDGFASMFAVTVDAIYDFSRKGHIGGYIGAGLGGYTRYWQLTTETVVGGWWCDPWTGWCYPSTVPGYVVADSDRLTKMGYQAVAAITFPMPSGAQLYLEASYHWMDTDPSTTYMPILLGWRW